MGGGTGPLHTFLGAVLRKGAPELLLEKRLLLTIHRLGLRSGQQQGHWPVADVSSDVLWRPLREVKSY